jgi:hypothetical protein
MSIRVEVKEQIRSLLGQQAEYRHFISLGDRFKAQGVELKTKEQIEAIRFKIEGQSTRDLEEKLELSLDYYEYCKHELLRVSSEIKRLENELDGL